MRRIAVLVTGFALAAAGVGASFALTGAETTGTVTACADATVPAQTVPGHTVGVDGTTVHTIPDTVIPAATASHCETVTYTVPTVTETVTTTVSAPPPSGADFVGDFEAGSYAPFDGVQYARAAQFSVVTSPVSHGTKAARCEVAPGDYTGGNTNQERCELVKDMGEKPGVESWWSWDTLLPSNFATDPDGWAVIAQWHDKVTATPSQPCLSIRIDQGPGAWSIYAMVNGGQRATGGAGGAVNPVYSPGFPYITGSWMHFLVHVKWAMDNTGLVELWQNGVQVWSQSGIPTLFTDSGANGVYFKLGLYRDADSVTSVLYEDNVLHGPTRASVGG